MSYRKRLTWKHSHGAIAAALAIGVFGCTLQASAQIVASKTRDLTPREQKSAIAFADVNSKKIMTVKGIVATFSRSGVQNIGAQIVLNNYVFSEGLCLVPVENLSAYRKVGNKSITWKIDKLSSHHLPPGVSYFVWAGNGEKDCKKLPQTGLVSLAAPIPTPVLKRLIKDKRKIKILALPLLRVGEKGPPDGHNKKLISGMQLSLIDLDFDWKQGYVYALTYRKKYAELTVHVSETGTKPVVLSAGIALP
ncbi:MAG: hypothetical protein ACRES9_02835 [Gammaproteobacteria bacterium]